MYSILTCSLDVLRLILSNSYSIRAMPFVIFGLVKEVGEVNGGGGGGVWGGVPAAPIYPLGEPLTANDVQHKYMCGSSENNPSNSQGASSTCPHVEVVKCMLLTASNTSSDFVKLNLHRNTQRRDHYHTNKHVQYVILIINPRARMRSEGLL